MASVSKEIRLIIKSCEKIVERLERLAKALDPAPGKKRSKNPKSL